MDPEVASSGTSVSTETVTKPADVTEPGSEICPPADAIATTDAADSPNMCENEKGANRDVEPEIPESHRINLAIPDDKRRKIIEEIRKRTGFSRGAEYAMETFFDSTQAIDLVLNTIASFVETPQRRPRKITLQDNLSESSLTSENPYKPTKPELKHLTWSEWFSSAWSSGVNTHGGLSAIDVLCEEPQVPRDWPASRRRPLLRALKASDVVATENRQANHSKKDGVVSLPEVLPARIRINSVPVQRILKSICEELDFPNGSEPLVMSRPFKALTHYNDDIHAKMDALERIRDERSANIRTANDQIPKDGSGTNGEACEDEGHNGGEVDADAKLGTEGPKKETRALRHWSSDMDLYTSNDWSQFTDRQVEEAVEDFHCLFQFVSETLQPFRINLNKFTIDSNDRPTSVNFSSLWHLFPTGCLIYVKDRMIPQKIWRVVQATGGRKYLDESIEEPIDWVDKYSPFVLDCYYLDFDGTKFVRVYHQYRIEMFEDTMSLAALQVMPLAAAERFLPGIDREDFRKRGKQFLDYTKPQHRYYQGTTITRTPSGEMLHRQNKDDVGSHVLFTERVESQVVIDFERGIQANPEWGPVSEEVRLWRIEKSETSDAREEIENDGAWDTRASEEFLSLEQAKSQRWDKGETLPEEDDLLLFPERVIGYILRTRSWACLRLNADEYGKPYLTQIDRQIDTWDDLQLPDGHKTVIQALINTHFSKGKAKDAHFDLVREKGKGVIVLLHGVPGVGKTATAECVAASHGKPLLPVTCGDLGLKPKEVEATLQTSFQLAQAWDCIMLLDEADIFLAQRTNRDIERNALVSVFLRVLEYYEGVLFLTTNRVGAFDEAFKSRIHMALYYPPLDWLTTDKIWRNLIRRARESPMKVDCNPDSLIAFAWKLYERQSNNIKSIGPAWNGRQIRNAFQSALALAQNESNQSQGSTALETSHFRKVADVSSQFNRYIWRVKSGRTDADVARDQGIRVDEEDDDEDFPQRQASQYPPPAQLQMPMQKPATPNINPFQNFAPTQPVYYQQPAYTTAAGSAYDSSQPASYGNPQAPPQLNFPNAYGTQQPAYTQQPQAPPGQRYQTSQAQHFQQYQPSQVPVGQAYQTRGPRPGYAQEQQPGAQSGFTATGGADQTAIGMSPQSNPTNQPST